jgi:hypothetical protein
MTRDPVQYQLGIPRWFTYCGEILPVTELGEP